LRSLETGLTGLDEVEIPSLGSGDDKDAIRAALANPSPERVLTIAQAFRLGMTVEDIHHICRYEPWFLRQIEQIVQWETHIRDHGLPKDKDSLRQIKSMGFSDARLATLTATQEHEVAKLRYSLDVHPVFKRVDTCAAEFEARTPYMYSTYETVSFDKAADCEAQPSDKKKVIILGGGPNRIGQGIEFDYCCCHAAYALAEAGYESIMVNCNPETVSTDYDTSDRLYFEPLTLEDVLELVRVEQSNGTLLGVIVQFGGQTPLNLAHRLEAAGVPILGTPPDAIDLAEDRKKFQQLLNRIGLKQPRNDIATSNEQALAAAQRVGYPLVIRPSYVLGGRAMEIVRDDAQLERYINDAVIVSGDSPVLIDAYLIDAIEVDVDAIADKTDVYVAGVMEHIEEAGIHSGDSACSLPPYSLSKEIVSELRQQTEVLARALGVVGLMNVQFAIQNSDIYVLEVNPRASRTVPFVAKTIGIPVAKIATRVMVGEALSSFKLSHREIGHIAVKEAVFPFARFPGVDTVLGPEMRSTGEVMGLDTSFERAFAKSQIASGTQLPQSGTVFVSVKDRDKPAIVAPTRQLQELGFQVMATGGTADFLLRQGIATKRINKVLEGRPHIVDAIKDGQVNLMFNTTEGTQSLADSLALRRAALMQKIPYYTTIAGARAATQAIETSRHGTLEVVPLQSYT